MILGGTNGSFRRKGAMVEGRDIFEGEVGRLEEGSEVRRSLVVERKMRERVRKGLEKRNDVTVGGDALLVDGRAIVERDKVDILSVVRDNE
jgi:hypothetical protein